MSMEVTDNIEEVTHAQSLRTSDGLAAHACSTGQDWPNYARSLTIAAQIFA